MTDDNIQPANDTLAILASEIEYRIVNSLNRRMETEGKKVQVQIRALSQALHDYVELTKHEIVRAIAENEELIELIARELARMKMN
jgi:hypothetical protein